MAVDGKFLGVGSRTINEKAKPFFIDNDGHIVPKQLQTIDIAYNIDFSSNETKEFDLNGIAQFVSFGLRWAGKSSDVDFDLEFEGKTQNGVMFLGNRISVFENQRGSKNISDKFELETSTNVVRVTNNQNVAVTMERLSATFYTQGDIENIKETNLMRDSSVGDNVVFDHEMTKEFGSIYVVLEKPQPFKLVVSYRDNSRINLQQYNIINSTIKTSYQRTYYNAFTPVSNNIVITVTNLDDEPLNVRRLVLFEKNTQEKSNLLVQHVEDKSLVTSNKVVYYGYDIGGAGDIQLIDKYRFKDMLIGVENNHEEVVTVRLFATISHLAGAYNDRNRLFMIDEYDLSPNDEKFFSSIDVPTLDLPYGGLVIQCTPVSGEDGGHLNMYIMGVER